MEIISRLQVLEFRVPHVLLHGLAESMRIRAKRLKESCCRELVLFPEGVDNLTTIGWVDTSNSTKVDGVSESVDLGICKCFSNLF